MGSLEAESQRVVPANLELEKVLRTPTGSTQGVLVLLSWTDCTRGCQGARLGMLTVESNDGGVNLEDSKHESDG